MTQTTPVYFRATAYIPLGTQSPAVARAYAHAILAAADLAESRPLTPDPIGEN